LLEDKLKELEAINDESCVSPVNKLGSDNAELMKFLLAQLTEYKPPKTNREMVCLF
jgi:hypothetical protein